MATGSARGPHPLYTALETRVAAEYPLWRAARPLLDTLLDTLRRGDGHPVLVMPGFTAADRTTASLRALLRHLGYRTYGWKLGPNLGPTPYIVNGMRHRFEDILDREDGEPVSIIGWSLGGIFGRELARTYPEQVRQVTTLGSPIRMLPGDRSAATPVWESLEDLHDAEAVEIMSQQNRPPLPVPTTSIYTRSDGIVPWQLCLETVGPQSENVEVLGSHCGLVFNPSTALVVADRLAQPTGTWKPFRPPRWARSAFRRPVDWDPPHLRQAA